MTIIYKIIFIFYKMDKYTYIFPSCKLIHLIENCLKELKSISQGHSTIKNKAMFKNLGLELFTTHH